MVKVKVISRSTVEWTKDRTGELPRANRAYDPQQQPMAQQVEHARAVRAAKLDRMFAKPFIGAMAGHRDTIDALAVDPTSLTSLASGSADGTIFHWNPVTRKPNREFADAHRGAVTGLVVTPDGVAMLSCSRDKTVKLWDPQAADSLSTYLAESALTGIDHHWTETKFATSGHVVEVWDVNRTRPIQQFEWGDETVTCVKYNKVETSLIACASLDRGVTIFDSRTRSGHSKIIQEVGVTSIAWNPMDPNVFVAGSDDWSCYLFDIRVTGRARNVFQGFVHPVASVDFAPTGRQFCAGSMDNTIRVWGLDQTTKTTSTEVFHTKRMAKVTAVRWSLCNTFIYSGSEDANVRVWKADSSKPLRALRGPEQGQFDYMRSLAERHAHTPDVHKVLRARKTPKAVRKLQLLRKSMQTREAVKEMSRKRTTEIKPLVKKKAIQVLK